jgi:adenine-specific DNA-methyltransferase
MRKKTKLSNSTQILPSKYAEKLGTDYATSKQDNSFVALGQYFTPQIVAELIAVNFSEVRGIETVRILDPGAGVGILSCALAENISKWANRPRRVEITAYEVDAALIPLLKESFKYLRKWLASKSIESILIVRDTDFVLENADILNQTLQHSLFDKNVHEKYDFIIANPPYFKISKSDYQTMAVSSIAHGQPNIYALFMAISAHLLKEEGQLCFITPRSYASGLYFKKFRQVFFDKITPVAIHLFESRDKAFNKDGVLQENIILHGKKDSSIDQNNHKVRISSCRGLSDIGNISSIDIPLSEIIAKEDGYILHIPTHDTQREVVKIIKSWKFNLLSLGLNVSTGPIVPFRTRDFLAETIGKSSAPLLWLHNIKSMQVSWPIGLRKPQYFKISQEARRFLVPNNNYVLVRRFSAKEEKKRLVAAPLSSKAIKTELIGIENHINYIYRKNGDLSEIETLGIAAILNSSLLDSYFRVFNGNTQVSATELRYMPLPDYHLIERIGALVKSGGLNEQEMDNEVVSLIKQYA